MIEEHKLTARIRSVLFYAKYYLSPDKPRPANPKHIILLVNTKLFQVLPSGFVSKTFHRLRGLFSILLVLGWTTPAQFTGLSIFGTSYTVVIEPSTRFRPVTYLALGDSTGLGVGAQNGYGYVEQLMTRIKIDHPGSRLLKLCRLGETTGSLRQSLNEKLSVKPTFVTLSIGTNDLLQRISEQEFAENYEAIVVRLRRLEIPIIITNLFDISFAPRLPNSIREETHVKVLDFNKRIEAIARRYGLFLVDLYTAGEKTIIKHREFFASDGFHPSDAGYEFWARTMWPIVRNAFEEREKPRWHQTPWEETHTRSLKSSAYTQFRVFELNIEGSHSHSDVSPIV